MVHIQTAMSAIRMDKYNQTSRKRMFTLRTRESVRLREAPAYVAGTIVKCPLTGGVSPFYCADVQHLHSKMLHNLMLEIQLYGYTFRFGGGGGGLGVGGMLSKLEDKLLTSSRCDVPVLLVTMSSSGLLASTSICKEHAKWDRVQILTVESREQDAIVKGLYL